MRKGRRSRSAALGAAAAVVLLLAIAPAGAIAGTAPRVDATWVTGVTASSANLHAEINPGGLNTTYRFEYLTRAAYLEKGETFTGAAKAPSSGEAFLGFGSVDELAIQHVSGLAAATPYEYRVVATNSASSPGGTAGPPRGFTTQESSPPGGLPDDRGWEMVSPVDKNGGAIEGPGVNRGGDVLQAAAQGGAITYSSGSSFGEAPGGAPPASQYVGRREPGGWLTENVTLPTLSGSYGTEPVGVPYRLFAPDLSRGLILNGEPCRGEGSDCPVANPPLSGTDAPAGYQNYYLRRSDDGAVSALLTHANLGTLRLAPSEFRLLFAGASPDLTHVVVATCAALTADATEIAAPEGCEAGATNLYEWSGGELEALNLLPGEASSTPGATLAAPAGAVSADGSRVYFVLAGTLYLREAGETRLVAAGGTFQAATPNGEVALYTKTGHLFAYSAATHSSSDRTPAGGVVGVLGASEDAAVVYYATGSGLFRWDNGAVTQAAPGPEAAQPSDFPPATGTARVSADGRFLLFVSSASEKLSGYDNSDQQSREADPQTYLYDGASAALDCLSCDPTGERPLGPSTIPGAIANGLGPEATQAYKPRALAAEGRRVFFDSRDSLLPADTDNRPDVYEWEADGVGNCARAAGCLALISSGRGEEGATFVDASATGDDAFFLTGESLVPADPGSADVYDARVGGGFPEPSPPIECVGDACQSLPVAAEDPTVGTLIPGPGNPPSPQEKQCPKGKRQAVRHGRVVCIAKHRHHPRKAGR